MNRVPSVSIIVPARDEAGNIEELYRRVPVVGRHTELIFVEGFSRDATWDVISRVVSTHSRKSLRVRGYQQNTVKGKEAATRLGFDKATGDILMILDADLSIDPEQLREFYDRMIEAPNRFINGSRFIYPQEKAAMRYLNNIGNIMFARIFSLILGMRVTDTLCGTKVLWKKDWQRLKKTTASFARHDPYGDFELFLGAHLLNLRIIEIPVVYKARVYGRTKISRFRDGTRLLFVLFSFILFLFRRKATLLFRNSKKKE